MPAIKLPSLESDLSKSIVTAAVAGATTYMLPARFPRWVRRGLSLTNTLTTVGAAIAGERKPAKSSLASSDANVVQVSDGKAVKETAANWAAASSAGVALVTSGIAIRIEKSAEKQLLKRGVRHPRLVMAVGAAAISFAAPYISSKLAELTEKLQNSDAAKKNMPGVLADPLKQHSDKPANRSIEASDGENATKS